MNGAVLRLYAAGAGAGDAKIWDMTDMRTNCPIIELIKYERFGHKKVGWRKC